MYNLYYYLNSIHYSIVHSISAIWHRFGIFEGIFNIEMIFTMDNTIKFLRI